MAPVMLRLFLFESSAIGQRMTLQVTFDQALKRPPGELETFGNFTQHAQD